MEKSKNFLRKHSEESLKSVGKTLKTLQKDLTSSVKYTITLINVYEIFKGYMIFFKMRRNQKQTDDFKTYWGTLTMSAQLKILTSIADFVKV